jgi:hypothetical protein
MADGSPLTEYHEPEAGDNEGRTHTRYVEAMTDHRFGVRLRFQLGFDFHFAPYVYYSSRLDDSLIYQYGDHRKRGPLETSGLLRKEV